MKGSPSIMISRYEVIRYFLSHTKNTLEMNVIFFIPVGKISVVCVVLENQGVLGIRHLHPSSIHHISKENNDVRILGNRRQPILPEVEIDDKPCQIG